MNNHSQYISSIAQQILTQLDHISTESWLEYFDQAYRNNTWFTKESCQISLDGIKHLLQPEGIKQWIERYPLLPVQEPKRIGMVMAGNIPAVGFHDLWCTLCAGHTAVVKLSKDDQVWMRFWIAQMTEAEPEWQSKILFQDQFKDVDAIIVTGTNNTAKHFEYYFRNIPKVIRMNRSSMALLQGHETEEDLVALSKDIQLFFGLGCRNVSLLAFPRAYDPIPLLQVLENENKHIIVHHRYFNNYEYQKAIFLVNQEPHLDNGSVLLFEKKQLSSPISTLHYFYYDASEEVESYILDHKDLIQCIVSSLKTDKFETIPFGKAQLPEIEQYADGVDTMKFLQSIC